MANRYLLFFLKIILSVSAIAQNSTIRPLKIGDFVPDVPLDNLLNYPSPTAKLSDFKGKLVILDFWNKGCSSCIQAFPKMQELQKEFEGKLQVLLVTANVPEELKLLFKQSPIIKKTRLPFKLADSIFTNMFPHFLEPYHVWIDANGKVIATTRDFNATPEHIRDYLEGKNIGFIVPRDLEEFNMDMYKPMLQEKNAKLLDNLLYYSVITKPLFSERSSGLLADSVSSNQSGMRFLDANLLFLFWAAYTFRDPFDRIIVEAKNRGRFFEPKDNNEKDAWQRQNTYCYEIRLPSSQYDSMSNEALTKKLLKKMQADLNIAFGVTAMVERRKLKCWVLSKPGVGNQLKTNGGFDYIQQDENHFIIRNADFALFTDKIVQENLGVSSHPLVDETGFTGKVDMDINASFTDISSLNKELKKYGLELKEQDRELKVLVIKDDE